MRRSLEVAALLVLTAALLSPIACTSASHGPRTQSVHAEGTVLAVDSFRRRVTIDHRSYRVTHATRLVGSKGEPLFLRQVPAALGFRGRDGKGRVEYYAQGMQLEMLRVLR